MNKKLHAKNKFSSNFYTKCKTDYPLRLSDTIFQSYKRKLNRFYHPHNIFSISNIILVYLEKKVQPEFSFKHLKKIHLNIYNYLHYLIISFFLSDSHMCWIYHKFCIYIVFFTLDVILSFAPWYWFRSFIRKWS